MFYIAKVQRSYNKGTVPMCDVTVEATGMTVQGCALGAGLGISSTRYGGVAMPTAGTRVGVALQGSRGPGVVLCVILSNAAGKNFLGPDQDTTNEPADVSAPYDGVATASDVVLVKNQDTTVVAGPSRVDIRTVSARIQVNSVEGSLFVGTEGSTPENGESAIHGEATVAYLETLYAKINELVTQVNTLQTMLAAVYTAAVPLVPPTPPVPVTNAAMVALAPLTLAAPILPPEGLPSDLISAILKFEKVPEEDV